jgi:hypothetical protein
MELADCIESSAATADQREYGDVVFGSGLKQVPGRQKRAFSLQSCWFASRTQGSGTGKWQPLESVAYRLICALNFFFY